MKTPTIPGSVKIVCMCCGRSWSVTNRKNYGLIRSAAARHTELCERRSPNQRRACNERDEAIWQRRPPKSIIRNNPSHKGLK